MTTKPKPQANRTKPIQKIFYLTDADLAILVKGWPLSGARSFQEFVLETLLGKAHRLIAKHSTSAPPGHPPKPNKEPTHCSLARSGVE